MSPQLTLIVGVAAMLFVMAFFLVIWAARYTKVGPNQVLIVSGRQQQLPDGKRIGFRIVKGGGTFVFPVFEKADVLSLEVFPIEMLVPNVRSAGGELLKIDCSTQVKIKGDDVSIVAAAEHFLSKSEVEVVSLVRPLLEKHLRATVGTLSSEEIRRNPEVCADRAQAASAADLARMGLEIISFSLRHVRAG